MEPWEDELLWDDDFSDEEEDTEEQIEEADLEMDEDGFADWKDSSDGAPENESLEEALAEERTLELESELEQDEHPRDYHAELEDEEEEAAPTSEKRLKREIRAEALKRLEEAARTESDFLTVVDEWNKLDRNRERRERDHENLRGDVPLEFQAVPDPKIAPLWMNLPRFRQLCQGNFLDIIFSCPYELHELTANRFLSKLFFTLSDEQKEVLYYLFVKQYSTTRLAAIRGQSDRNIRKLRLTIQKKLQKLMDSQDVAIYTVANHSYARLFSATSPKARMLGNSIHYVQMEELYEKLREKKVFINKTMDERYPLMADAIYSEDEMQLILMVWGIPWERMTLGQANMLTVIGYLIQNAVVRANRYLSALEQQRYIHGTRILEADAFASLVKAYLNAREKKLTECALVVFEEGEISREEAAGVLSGMMRQSDYLGELSDGKMYALLANTSAEDAGMVVERFRSAGFPCRMKEEMEL